jgi:hypothetical protein
MTFDWLQFSLAMSMAFVGLEVIASALRAHSRDLGWMAFWAIAWALTAGVITVARLIG